MTEMSRRDVLGTAGAIGAASVAGCAGSEEEMEELDATEYDGVDEWLGEDTVGAPASNYDEVIHEFTSPGAGDPPTVTVGAGYEGSNLVFDPVALLVPGGTQVRFEWTGEGGAHNVVCTEEDAEKLSSAPSGVLELDSGEPETEAGVNFATGGANVPRTAFYKCEPHLNSGMKGVVVWR